MPDPQPPPAPDPDAPADGASGRDAGHGADRDGGRDARRHGGAGLTRRRGRLRRIARGLGLAAGAAGLAGLLWIAAYAVWLPPTTLLIETERARLGAVDHRPVRLAELPPLVRLAFPAAEDARFCAHRGFDLIEIERARADAAAGGRVRGASTISQQTAKNAYLWPARSWTRKAVEAGVTVAIETVWSKARILEVYLNVAEMGEGVFGLEAAAQTHFGKPAAALTAREAALIAAALPSPRTRNPARPSDFLNRRARSIVSGAETLAAGGGACVLGR